jgi:hypothetical protein
MRRLSFSFSHSSEGLEGVAMLIGPAIDKCLERVDALATALDGSTILLSSRLLKQPRSVQRLVACHELAHVVQLRRGGTDPEGALEAEAWHAAERAVRGLPFYIDLGSSHPLAATALVAMDGRIGDDAMAHYQRFHAERLIAAGGIPVTTVTRVSPVALDTLLDAIIADFSSNGDKSFVLAAHGSKEGLTMPIVPHSAFKANTTSLHFFLQPNAATQTLQAPRGVHPPSPQEISSIVGKAQQIRQLGLVNVEFRGCNIGADMANLETMREFLSSTSVSAPDVKSSWAVAHVNILSSKQFDQWAKKPGVTVSQYPTGRCGILVQWDAHLVVMAAESNASVAPWLKDHFLRMPPFPSTPSFEGWMLNLPLHGLHTNPILFPADAGYPNHIKRVIMTPNGLVRM